MDPKASESAQDGNLRHATHGLFAKIQQKTGIDDKKIEEFQKKWLETPEVRTKYKHWWDTTAIAGEELNAMFNDIIDFMQDQKGGNSRVFASLREEADQIRKNPQAYFRHLVVIGKNWMDRGAGVAKTWIKKGGKLVPPTKIDETIPKIEEKPAETAAKTPPAGQAGETPAAPGEEKAKEAQKADEEWFGGKKEVEKPKPAASGGKAPKAKKETAKKPVAKKAATKKPAKKSK